MKRARIRVTAEILADIIGPLGDAGYVVVGSESSLYGGIVILVIEGYNLPDACLDEWREVTFNFTKETYGRQSIIRVSAPLLVS